MLKAFAPFALRVHLSFVLLILATLIYIRCLVRLGAPAPAPPPPLCGSPPLLTRYTHTLPPGVILPS